MNNKIINKKQIGAVVLGVGLVVTTVTGFLCIERVPAGYVGVVYSTNGGVQDTVLTSGWNVVAPNKKVTLYSTATESFYMSADKKDGSKEDDSFDVVCKDGVLNVDLEMSYSFDADKVPALYERYRGMSGNDIMSNIIRGKVKTFANEVTSKYTVLEAHMEKKSELNKELTEHLRNKLSEFGVEVEGATFSRTQPSAEVEQAIIKRTTTAQELEAEKQRQEKAKLEQETKRIEAETKAIENQKINESLTQEMLVKMWIEKWDGKLSIVSGDGVSVIAPMGNQGGNN